MEPNLFLLLAVAVAVGAAAGYLGAFMVLKRMALVGDALSHVALPGMALALILNFSPLLGALAALTIAVLGIWYFEETTRVYPEALVGLFFTTSLALGILLTPKPELLESLFGSLETLKPPTAILTIVSAVGIIFLTYRLAQKLLLGIISKELLESVGISYRRVNLIYLLLVGAVVALGVQFVGTLLTGALVIIPAVSAKTISRSGGHYHLSAAILGVAAALTGVLLAYRYQLPVGPLVVLVSVFFFTAGVVGTKIAARLSL